MNRSQRSWGAAGLSAAVVAILWSAAGANTGASLAGAKVDNFMLADQSGMGHELYYYNAQPGHRAGRLRQTATPSRRAPPPLSPKSATHSRARTCSS